jgi:hypothetical protein
MPDDDPHEQGQAEERRDPDETENAEEARAPQALGGKRATEGIGCRTGRGGQVGHRSSRAARCGDLLRPKPLHPPCDLLIGLARVAYRDHFIGQWPIDTTIMPISRTSDDNQIVDEMLISFTHDRIVDCILPGVAPTGRKIEVPTVVVARFENGKLACEHIYWDQASVLVQAGLIDPVGLPVAGAEIAAKLTDPRLPSNTLIKAWASGS